MGSGGHALKAPRVAAAAAAVAAVACGALLAAGCGGGGGSGGALRIGYFPNITHQVPILSRAEGILERRLPGVEVEWKRFLSGPEAMSALLSGSLDASYVGPGPVVTASSRAPGRVAIVAGAAEAGALLIARKGSGIRSVLDLDGRSVAIPGFGNTQDLALRNLIHDEGLGVRGRGGTVKITPIDNPELENALENDVVDAAMTPEPWAARVLDAGAAEVVLDADDIEGGRYPTTVLAVSTGLDKERPQVVDALVAANAEAVRLARGDPALVARRYNELIEAGGGKPLSDAVLGPAIARTRPTTDVPRAEMQLIVDAARRAGYLRDDVRVDDVLRLRRPS